MLSHSQLQKPFQKTKDGDKKQKAWHFVCLANLSHYPACCCLLLLDASLNLDKIWLTAKRFESSGFFSSRLEPLQIDSNNNKRSRQEEPRQEPAHLFHSASNCFADSLPTSDYSSGAEDFCNIPSVYDFRKASLSSNQLYQMATEADPNRSPRIYKLVLTGGPCGGKTTGQDRLATFFENMGWKVFTVPEAATVLLRGGVKFTELNAPQTYQFQKDLLLTLLQIEKVFFNQAELIKDRNVLIICDRGAMDPSAYMDSEGWEKMLKDASLNIFDLRDNRYNQVVHMVTAADGAEPYYTLKNNSARSEGIKQAMEQDKTTKSAWVGHPYVDVVDNRDCITFNDKILRLIQVVCDRLGLPSQDRLSKNSKKRKWLINGFDESQFSKYEEFSVRHDYLLVSRQDIQVRIRVRCQNNRSTYTLTNRRFMKDGSEPIETRMQLNVREYNRYLAMKDKSRVALHKKRRCFNFGNEYFNLDMFVDPLPPACNGQQLMILETYTTKPREDSDFVLPPFLHVDREITGEQQYSMYSLSMLGVQPMSNGLK